MDRGNTVLDFLWEQGTKILAILAFGLSILNYILLIRKDRRDAEQTDRDRQRRDEEAANLTVANPEVVVGTGFAKFSCRVTNHSTLKDGISACFNIAGTEIEMHTQGGGATTVHLEQGQSESIVFRCNYHDRTHILRDTSLRLEVAEVQVILKPNRPNQKPNSGPFAFSVGTVRK